MAGAYRSRPPVLADASQDDAALATVVGLIPTPAFICDRDDGTIRYANPLLESFLGVTRDKILGRSVSDFYRDPRERTQFLKLLEENDVVNGRQMTVLRSDGSERWIEASSRRVVWGGRPSVLTTFADIDAVKRAQLASEADRVQASELAEISAIVAHGRPGDEVFISVSEVVARLVAFDRLGIATLDPEDNTFSLVFVRGTPVAGREQGTNHAVDDSLNSYVIRERTGLVLDAEDPGELLDRFPSLKNNLDVGLISFLTAPMIADDRVVGTISLRSETARAYTEVELAIIEQIAALLAPALEQARLYADLEQEAREREIIAEIGRVISASPEIDEAFARFAELVRALIPSDLLTVSILTDDRASFKNILYSGKQIPGREIGEINVISGSVIEATTRTRRMVMLHPQNRAQAVAAFPQLSPVWDAGFRSFLSLPLITNDRVVGVLHLRSKSSNAYDDHHVQLGENVAAQASGVIAISLLRAAERREAETNAALAGLSRILDRPNIDRSTMDEAAETMAGLVPFDRIELSTLDPKRHTFTLIYASGVAVADPMVGDTHGLEGSTHRTLVDTHSPLVLTCDGPEELAARYPRLQPWLLAGLRSFLSVPLISGGEVIATIAFGARSPDTYGNAHARTAERIALQLAPALEKGLLYRELEQELSDRRIIADIGRVISSSPDVDDVYGRFADLVRQIIPADRVAVTALEDGGKQFVLLYNSGTTVTERSPGRRLPIEGSMIGEVVRTRGTSLFHAIDRAQVERDYPALAPLYDAGLRSFLTIPLFVGDRCEGALHFFSKSVHEYSTRHLLLAESVAGQIAGVIASSLLRAAELQSARENAALAEIGRIISSSLDIRGLYEEFARRVNEVVPCDRLVVTTLDLEGGTATDLYVYGIKVPGWSEGTVHEIDGTPFDVAARTRQVQYTSDVTTDMNDDASAREAISAAGLHSSMVVPLISNGDVIGTLNLKCAAQGAYTSRHGELAQRIADQIAGAIANVGFYEDLEREADERRALGAIGLAATQDLDLDGVFDRAADALQDVMAYDRMSISLFDADVAVLRVAFERGERLGDFRAGAVVTPAKGDPFDGGSWIWQSGYDTGLHPDGRLRSTVTAPLGSHIRHLGYIKLRSNTADAYDERSTETLERVAGYLTPAVQNALEHRQAMRLTEERERSLVLDRENQELLRLNDAKSQFLSTVSHELKTPLTSITAFTDILLKNQRGGMTDRDLSQLAVIQRNNRRLGNLIGDLLDLSRLDRDAMDLVVTEFEIAELVAEVVDVFGPIANAKSQPIVHSVPSRPVYLRADRDRLMQVMTNLLSNASKYSQRDAPITLVARRWKDRMYFSVTDCGIGISEEDRESLFTLFFRADNEETRTEPGTGIGLYIAQSIVELHGGKITVTSDPGDGTTVSFYVPGASSEPIDAEPEQPGPAEVIPWSRLGDLPEPREAAG